MKNRNKEIYMSIPERRNRKSQPCKKAAETPDSFGRQLRGGFKTGTEAWTKAFTLIELLVVVLIIGILAAIAVPQYQKAVEKSKATQALIMLRSVASAAQRYYMANGTYPTKLTELDITIPWTGQVVWRSSGNTLSNTDWSLQFLSGSDVEAKLDIYMGRISGPYTGGGFVIFMESFNGNKMIANKIYCVERKSLGIIYRREAGSYCHKLFNTSTMPNYGSSSGSSYRAYLMP